MSNLSPAAARNIWIGLITVASAITTLVLACATPFPALAALAALYVRRSEGLMLMAAAWATSQAIGFGLNGYALDGTNFAWSVALACGAVGSLLVARYAAARAAHLNPLLQLSIAYVAAYLAFKSVVFVWTLALDEGWAAFSAEVLARQFVRYGLILGGLVLLHRLLVWAGISASRDLAMAKA